ncbi:MAG TPA: hypothetical protein VMB03_31380 [Bryobacteraceae bacterium]|nr:hypothetical protein [Bryobacteraceae bacterium]
MALLICTASCGGQKDSNGLAALDKAYQAGVITKAEYVAKKAAIEKRAGAEAALEKACKAGVLTRDECRAKKAALAGSEGMATLVAPAPSDTPARDRQAIQPQVPADAARTDTRKNLRVQAVYDQSMGNMLASRFLVPRDWKADGKVVWNYRDLYMPFRASIRADAPDGSGWFESFPAEDFFYGDHEGPNPPPASFGAIHYRNITVQQAVAQYVIRRYRAQAQKLQILGYRPVNNLGKALGHPEFQGDGICFRIRYEVDGQPADEEFYGLLTVPQRYSFNGPRGTWYEYHRHLIFVHSFGARNGKLESLRPVLGLIEPSMEANQAWVERSQEIRKEMGEEYNRQLKRGFDQIHAAAVMSQLITENSDRFLKNMDAQLAASRVTSQRGSGGGDDPSGSRSFEARADDFDQYLRDTEHVVDAWGQVSDQSDMYNYHWTDGWGNWVHTNDPNYDPNATATHAFEKATPIKQ